MEKKLFKPLNIEVKAKDEDKREITAVGSKQVSDRDGDIVFLDGMSLTNFRKNPVVLWSHNSSMLPIGKANKVWVDNKELKFKMTFAGPEENPFADSVFRMVKSGFLNSLSIGFAPDWKSAKFQEKRGGYDFPKSELLEVSMVAVGANQGARVVERMQKAFEAGIIDEVERKDFELTLKEMESVEQEEPVIEEQTKEVEEDRNIEEFLVNKIQTLEDEIYKLKATQKQQDLGEEPKSLHIVDQVYQDIFASSDEESNVDADEVAEDTGDLNSFIDGVLNNG